MMKLQSVIWILSSLFIMGLGGCSTELEIFEEPEDIWVVYGVLDPAKSKQVIRVSKVFQIKADAYVFAENYDPSELGLKVVIEGDGKRWEGIEINNVLKDTTTGDFGPTTNLYEIETVGDDGLKAGVTYSLRITKPGVDTFLLTSQTTIPPRPRVLTPRISTTRDGRCLPVLPIEEDLFIRFNPNPDKLPISAAGFQVEVQVSHLRDGVPRIGAYGPTAVFTRSEACTSGSGQLLCQNFKNGIVLAALRASFKAGAQYTYDSSPTCGPVSVDLVQSVKLKVHAHDVGLTNYLLVNRPRINDLQQIRPEYTNIEGNGRTLGIFGSTQTTSVPAALSPCAEYIFYFQPSQPFMCPDR